ncbi:MAG: DUF120 domain-containing protein [Thermoplasmatales archaeon]
MNPVVFDFLKKISYRHNNGKILINTKKISSELGISQQSVSRYLIILEDEGYILRKRIKNGEEVVLTEKAFKEFRNEANALQYILGRSDEIELEGILFTGLGEGSYYISREGYVSHIKMFLGFTPFPGTLNIRLTEESEGYFPILNTIKAYDIQPFEQEGRKFGGVRILKAKFRDNIVGIVIPDRTHYENVIELISPDQLRTKFSLKDGDTLKVTVFRNQGV